MPNYSNNPMAKSIDVLIVDDNAMNIQILEFILGDQSLNTLSCTDADNALALATNSQPGLILLDIMMPVRNGFEICAQLKGNPATAAIPVIFITAMNSTDAEEKGFAVGGVDYILKPFNATTVVARVKTHLQLHRSQEYLEAQVTHRTQNLNDTLRELARISRAKDEFLAMASHELRTPLNGLVGTIHLLKQEAQNQSSQTLLSAATTCASSLSYIVENLLIITELNAGTLKILERAFSIRPLLNAMIRTLEHTIQSKGLLLDISFDALISEFFFGDIYHILRALSQILSNAIKFTPAGTISLRVSAQSGPDENTANVKFKVTDSGIGIAPEIQSKMFSLFQQGDGSIRRQHGGLGTGLALAHALTTTMNGDITCHSLPGVGSTFIITLPLRIASESQVGTETDVQLLHIPAGRSALIVEDNAVNLLIQSAMVRKLGLTVMTAENGAEALTVLQQHIPDVILMDCQMPVLDGFEATRQIRKLPGTACKIPIIAVTANATSLDRERCFVAGMNDYLQKPVNPTVLTAKLSKWLSLTSI